MMKATKAVVGRCILKEWTGLSLNEMWGKPED